MVVVTLPNTTFRAQRRSPRPSRTLTALRSDEQLLAQFRAGDNDAFAVLFDRHRAKLLRYVRRMLGSSADAEDVLQDVFLRAYRSLRNDERELPVKAWLFRVTHNRAIDTTRRPVVDQAEVHALNRPAAIDPVEHSERRDSLRRLVRDVQALPGQQRSALLMRELEGLSYQEVADALDTTVPAVKSLLVRARVGLVDAAAAEDTSCVEVRAGLDDARRRGVRMTGLARRHLVTCRDCRDHHDRVRALDRAVAAVDGGPAPVAWLAQLLGFGSAGGAAAASGGGAGAVGGFGFLGATTAKVAAAVATAVVVGGGAVQATHHTPASPERPATGSESNSRIVLPAASAPLELVREVREVSRRQQREQTAERAAAAKPDPAPVPATTVFAASGEEAINTPDEESLSTGGTAAPDDLADPSTAAPDVTLPTADPAPVKSGAEAPGDQPPATASTGTATTSATIDPTKATTPVAVP